MKFKLFILFIFIIFISLLDIKNPIAAKNPKAVKDTKGTKELIISKVQKGKDKGGKDQKDKNTGAKDQKGKGGKNQKDKDKDTGLQLGVEQYFKTKGEFNITIKALENAIQINMPSMKVNKFVIYRSIKKEGLYKKVGLTKKKTYMDKKIDKDVEYYYVAVALVKQKSKWKKLNSNKAKGIIKEVVITEVEVSFNSTPKGAIVIINNQNIGKTPVSKKYKVGMYQLTIQKEGYKTYKNFNFNIEYKPKININVKLEKLKGSLNITTTPSGAAIKLNKKTIGKSPVRQEELEFENYEIEATLKDYRPVRKVVVINSETPASVNIVLKKIPRTGNVHINSKPLAADILIDNIKHGKTPALIKNINAGIHTLILRKKDFNEIKKDIEIETNKTKNYNFTLVKKNGFLTVITFPDDSECFLNDKLIGKTPVKTFKINKGTYNLVVKKENYYDFKEMIQINVDKHLKRDIILSILKSTLIINTYPEKAKILIQEKNYGFTPFISDNIQPGKIKIEIIKKGYKPITEELTLSPNSTENLSYKLKPIEVKPTQLPPKPQPQPTQLPPKPQPQPTQPPTKPQPQPTQPPTKPQPQPTQLPPKPQPQPIQLPPKPQVPVIQNGTLTIITTPPSAEVYVNNKLRGLSPLILSLKPGKYNIKIKKTLFKDWTGTTTISSKKIRKINTKLIHLESYMSINSTPKGAEIYLNNINYGKTPRKFKIHAGNYVVNLKKQDYETYSTALKITGTQREIKKNYTLKKEVKRYYFDSIPRNAEVSLNNKIIGITPFEYLDIKDGIYDIKFRKTGYRLWQSKKQFSKGKPSRVTATLDAMKGDLLINSTPPSCDVYVNNRRSGVTGRIIKNIPAGYHRIKVSKYGYYDFNSRIRIYDSQQLTHKVELIEKPKGNIKIDSTPQGAKIYLDNQFKNTTPMLLEKIPEDRYKLRLKADGYKSFNTTVSVIGNRTEYINAQLIPGSDCCLGNSLMTKPVFWYIASAVSLIGSGWAWYEEERILRKGSYKHRQWRDLHRGRNTLAITSGTFLMVGITFSIFK